MNTIESIIDKYYKYNKIILSAFAVLFILIIVAGLIYLIIKKENMRYIVNKLIYKIIYVAIIAVMGILLSLMGLMLNIEYVYFNAIVFMFFIGTIVVYEILMSLMYKQILLPVLQCFQYIQMATFFEVFLLAVTHHLECVEWVAGVCCIVGLDVTIMPLEKRMRIQKGEKESNKENDYPNPDLFPTREKQLKNFKIVLKQLKQEPYSIMISGEWGVGKTSFIKRLEKELCTDSFIWVYAGSEKTVTEIMSEISTNILDILRKNNIFLEHKDLIEGYFLAFTNMLEDKAFKPMKKLSTVFVGSKDIDDREYLNNKLDHLGKTIYLIIDDLDRCDHEYQIKMFKVIRESMELHNCKTIFLVDREKFLDEKNDAGYIEKYVSYTLDLCEVGYQEIKDYYIKDILDDEFIQNMDDVFLKNRSAEQIRDSVYRCPIHLIEYLKGEILKKNKESEKSASNKDEDEINKFEQTELKVEKNVKISRKVKNYIKGVKRNVEILNDDIGKSSEAFLQEDWLDAIIKVQSVKNFLPEIFNDIKMSGDIAKYRQSDIYGLLESFFNINIYNENKEEVLNYIIYNIDVIDFSQVITKPEKYLSELHNDQAVNSHIVEYINLAKEYKDLDKILDIYRKPDFKDKALEERAFEKILAHLSDRGISFPANTQDFLDFSKNLMNCLGEKGLSDKSIRLCINAKKDIIAKAILDNSQSFFNVLSIVNKMTIVEEEWSLFLRSDISIDGLYECLKKIDKETIEQLNTGDNKISSIEEYFRILGPRFMNERDSIIEYEWNSQFSYINLSLLICKFWDNIESFILNRKPTEKLLIESYFILEDKYTFRGKVFDSVSYLAEALKKLEAFYRDVSNDYKSDYSRMLLNLSRKVVLLYDDQPEWFEGRRLEIEVQLEAAAKLAIGLDKAADSASKKTIEGIKRYIYKFRR